MELVGGLGGGGRVISAPLSLPPLHQNQRRKSRNHHTPWGHQRTSVLRGSGQPTGSTHCRPGVMLPGRRDCSIGTCCWSLAACPLLPAGSCAGAAAPAAASAAAATAAAAPAAAHAPATAPAVAATFFLPLPLLPPPTSANSWANCVLPEKATTAGAPQPPQVQPMAAAARRVCISKRAKKAGRHLCRMWARDR